MKKTLLLLVFILALGLVPYAEAWNPNGTWVNLDGASGGTHSLDISFPTIHGYGQCTPTPCDWGNAGYTSKLVATNDSSNADRDEYMAVWLFSFKWTFVYISAHPENPDYIILRTYDLYDIMGDSRTNRFTIEYLKRQ